MTASFDYQRALYHVGVRVPDLEAAMAGLRPALGITWAQVIERDQPVWTPDDGAYTIPLLHDNALDRTHFPYVHPHRIQRGYVEDPPPLKIEVTETTVSYSRTFTPAPLAGWQRLPDRGGAAGRGARGVRHPAACCHLKLRLR